MPVDIYPKANRTAQWFGKNYPGKIMPRIDRVILHTTEGGSWPAYDGGAVAPTLTAFPNTDKKILEWRQHFPINMSARALRNEPGGVETNTFNLVQVELIGSCLVRGMRMYWPEAPEWALRQLGEFLVWMNQEWGVPFNFAKRWAPAGATAQYRDINRIRFSDADWLGFRGIAGHQHVPENYHVDPGALDVLALQQLIEAPYGNQEEDMPLTDAEVTKIANQSAEAVWNRFGVRDADGSVINLANTLRRTMLAAEATTADRIVLAILAKLQESDSELAVKLDDADVQRIADAVIKAIEDDSPTR